MSAAAADVFLSYSRTDSPAVRQIQAYLKQTGLITFLDRDQLPAGQPWLSALEQAIARCAAVAVLVGPAGLGTWQQREIQLALDRQAEAERAGRSFPVIPVLLTRADPALGFLELNSWVDLSGGANDPEGLATLSGAIRCEPPGAVTRLRIEAIRAAICPYRGLQPFREEDEPFFFGRTILAETLTAALLHHPFVAVVGASGSGKSSVLRAGLIPRLRRGAGGLIWDVVSLVPSDRPLFSLAAALLPLLEPDLSEVERLAQTGELAKGFGDGAVGLQDVVARVLSKQPGTNRLLLFVDQWEEVYSLCEDDGIRRAFINQLLGAVANDAIRVALTIRGDFMGQALCDRNLAERLQHGIVAIGPMARDELSDVILQPATKIGLSFEAGLPERILDDVGDEPGGLPLLEFMLEALWTERRGGILTHEAYARLGSVSGALAHRAENVFESLNEAERQAAKRLLIRMVRPGEGVAVTRRPTTLPLDDPIAANTVLKLEQERLVVIDREPNSGAATVALAHEALILSWKRLCDWINENREFLRTYERIATDARLWDAEGRPADLLLPAGRRLAEGERLLESRQGDLDPQFITYVQLSAAAAQQTQGGFNKLFHFFGVSAAWDELEKRKKAVAELRHQIQQLEMRELEMKKGLSLREIIITRASQDADYTSPMVFLSYAREDTEFVRQLASVFKGYGFRTWFDKDDILPGQRWKTAIEKAIREAHFLVFCISRHSAIKRGFIQVEQKLALEVARSIPDDQIYFIPARVEECPIPSSLSDYQCIDLFEKDGLDKVRKAIVLEWAKMRALVCHEPSEH